MCLKNNFTPRVHNYWISQIENNNYACNRAWVVLPKKLKSKNCAKYKARKIKLEDLFKISYGILNVLKKRKLYAIRTIFPINANIN